jgi:hypothetical protein
MKLSGLISQNAFLKNEAKSEITNRTPNLKRIHEIIGDINKIFSYNLSDYKIEKNGNTYAIVLPFSGIEFNEAKKIAEFLPGYVLAAGNKFGGNLWIQTTLVYGK